MIGGSESAFDVAQNISRLRKGGDLKAALALYEQAIRRWPGDVNLMRAHVWCRYDADIKAASEDDDAGRLRRVAATTRWVAEQELSSGLTFDKYDPTPFVVLRGCSRLIKAQRFEEADRLLAMLDPSRLSTESDNADFDSHCTEWFRLRTKCLSELERWDELVALADLPGRARLSGKYVHWVEYRIALGFRQLGRAQDALSGVERALRGKNDAWIKVLRAELLAELDRNDEALELLRLALASANNDDALQYLVNGLRQLAALLQSVDADRASAHLRVLTRVLQHKNWPLRPADRDLAARLGVDLVPADDKEVDALRRWWKAAEESRRLEGRITKVLPNGGSGFLATDDGTQYYFAMPRRENQSAPPVGARVSFVLTDGFDNKRKIATKQATRLKVVGRP